LKKLGVVNSMLLDAATAELDEEEIDG